MPTHLQFNGKEVNYFDEENQPVDFVDDEPIARSFKDGQKLVSALFEQTDYASRYANSDENLNVLIRVARKLNRHDSRPDALTVSRLIAAYKTADAAGGECGDCGVLEKLPPPVQAQPRPRDASGKFVNPVLAEYYRLLEDRSVAASQINRHMIQKFGENVFRAALEAEAASQRQQVTSEPEVSAEELARLRKFADAYRREPSIRFLSGYATIGDQQYTRQQLDANVEAASKLRLL